MRLGATRVSMSVILLAAPINVLLNYLLIYGHWGFPELGGAGAGYASAITYWLVFFIACAIAWRWGPFVDYKLFVAMGKNFIYKMERNFIYRFANWNFDFC